MTILNRTFKDSVFRDLFGSERWKQNTLSLYNALNGTAYEELDSLELTTIDNAIYMGYKNDVSFLIGGELILWEHQSTRNPNMPLRGLLYFAELFSKLFAPSSGRLYSTKPLSLPSPHYYVFYIGTDYAPEKETIRLSDIFTDGPGDLEVTATVLNINAGNNLQIMQACNALADYSYLVESFRKATTDMNPEEAIAAAIDQCISEGILVEYLQERRSEVISTFLTEWNEEAYRAYLREESREDGRAEGLAEGRAAGRAEGRAEERAELIDRLGPMVDAGELDVTTAAKILGCTEEALKSDFDLMATKNR